MVPWRRPLPPCRRARRTSCTTPQTTVRIRPVRVSRRHQAEDADVVDPVDVVHAGDREDPGTGPRRDQAALEAQSGLSDADCVGSCEARLALEHVHAGVPEPGGAVVVCDVRPDATHALHRRAEVHLDPIHADTHDSTMLQRVHGVGSGQHALARDAPEVQAVAAEHVLLDQRHCRAQASAAHRGHQPCGSASEHHQVVALGGSRDRPVPWLDVGQEPILVAQQQPPPA